MGTKTMEDLAVARNLFNFHSALTRVSQGHPNFFPNYLDNTLLRNQTKWILEGGQLPSQNSIPRVVWTNDRTCNLSRPQLGLATHAVQEVKRIT